MKPVLNTDRLRKLREAKGWSKNVASQEMGLLQSQYLRYENGGSIPSVSVLRIMALTLGTTVDYLTDQTDEKAPREFLVKCRDTKLSYIIEQYSHMDDNAKDRLFQYTQKLVKKHD